ncbi:MAG: hypothetical protein ACOYI3_08950, partial [Christensenellales bacterium]
SDGDAILLCSDGLTNEVSEENILDALRSCKSDPDAACDTLIEHALKRGGKDNISVAIGFFFAEGGDEG